jgi:EAL domain-containing protein (putative c-di-GMP-specific phosphodiesterase class I)
MIPLDYLKVDRSFVSGLPEDSDSRAIVRAILAMSDSLGLRVIAEGVETLDQAQLLKDMGCDTLQGYFFSKPVPAEDIPALLTGRWVIEGPKRSRLLAAGSPGAGSAPDDPGTTLPASLAQHN